MDVKVGVIVWLLLSSAFSNLLPHYPDPDVVADSISSMTGNLVDKYFSQSYCIGVVAENGHLLREIVTVAPTIQIYVSTVPEMADNEEFKTLRKETTQFDKTVVKLLNQGCLSFIIQVRNPTILVQYFSRASRRSGVRSNRRYLYLPVPETLSSDASNIFEMKEMNVMPDLVVAKLERNDKVVSEACSNTNDTPVLDYVTNNSKIENVTCACTSSDLCPADNRSRSCFSDQELDRNDSTHDIAGIAEPKNSCENRNGIHIVTHSFVGSNPSTEVWLDTWIPGKGFLKGNNLYPNKLRNLQGKMMTVAAVPSYPPYTIINTSTTPPIYDGIELRFAKEFARSLNFTFRVITDDLGWWGEVWPNGSGNGMWGNVAMDVAFLGFGATYAWLENYPHLDYSLPYFRSSVRCLTPRPRQLPGWMTPILPFSPAMWVAVGVSMLITTASLYLVTKAITLLIASPPNHRFSTMIDSVISAVGLLLLQVPNEERSFQYVPLRHLLAWLMVFFLLINSIYSGGLASVLTVPRFEHPINSVADLARSEMIWAAPIEAWVFSIQEATEPDLAHLTHNFRVMNEEQLLIHAIKGDLAFAVERLLGGNYALSSYVNEKTVINLRAMRDDMYSGSPVFNVRKASPFMESINTLVLKMHAAGLLLNYEGQVVREFLSQRVQLVLAQNDQATTDTGPVTLHVEHVQGPLFLLGFGLMGALIVFIMEVLKNSSSFRINFNVSH